MMLSLQIPGLIRLHFRQACLRVPYSATITARGCKMATFTRVELDHPSRSCLLKHDDGNLIGTYPYVWLRDNCRCDKCFHPSSRGRLVLMGNLDPDILPDVAEVEDQTLNIRWPDDHRSQFPLSWLKEMQFSDMSEDPVSTPVRQFWGNEMQHKIPTFSFADILNKDKSLHDWIEALRVHGLALIKDAPHKEGAVLEIGKRISFLKTTHYGNTFQVLTKFEANNLAYTNAELGLHVDLPFNAYPPNIQMLHCIKQVHSTGGENQFCDGYKVAEDIKHVDPEVFRILTTIPVDFRDCGTEYNVYHVKHRSPIIQLLPDGRYKAISYNDQVRAPYIQIPVQDVYKIYQAIKMLNTELYKEENKIQIKLAEGDIVSFDNQRVLHGRSGFVVTETSERHLEGAYIDWDEACSRMRVIREKMLNEEPL
ncbi:gamma-butyrobetaine dioxygenase-like [Amphiura filiformis]|uniref:gamma-butyrobetaine dioxygenase-like n=1 Tax=Amphiura filiformis TaxID=82378 RepID=UPI003B226A24